MSPEDPTNPDLLEVAPGAAHDKIEGWVPSLASPDEIRAALEKAFDYRGDITVTLKNGLAVEGYIFDRRSGSSLQSSVVRLLPSNGEERITISYSDIAALAFTGRDTAAGKSWEAWVRKYLQKKAAGEKGIRIEPDSLD